jgi:hypothetical protein
MELRSSLGTLRRWPWDAICGDRQLQSRLKGDGCRRWWGEAGRWQGDSPSVESADREPMRRSGASDSPSMESAARTRMGIWGESKDCGDLIRLPWRARRERGSRGWGEERAGIAAIWAENSPWRARTQTEFWAENSPWRGCARRSRGVLAARLAGVGGRAEPW